MLDSRLTTCREVGYGVRLGEKLLPKTSSTAMPVKHEGQIVACLTVIWITSVLSNAQARETLVGPMIKPVKEMEQSLSLRPLR
jgi:DNA-binding IclR family transcriptional regulator